MGRVKYDGKRGAFPVDGANGRSVRRRAENEASNCMKKCMAACCGNLVTLREDCFMYFTCYVLHCVILCGWSMWMKIILLSNESENCSVVKYKKMRGIFLNSVLVWCIMCILMKRMDE